MAKLIYSAIMSLDGYVEDAEGKFDWAAPDDEVHAFVNDVERPIGSYLYGRRMYETMVSWEVVSTGADQPAVIRDFAQIWRAAEKIVYSRTLRTVSSARTRIERDFDPDAVRRLKETSAADITLSRRLAVNLNSAFMGDTKGGAFDVLERIALGLMDAPNPHGRPRG